MRFLTVRVLGLGLLLVSACASSGSSQNIDGPAQNPTDNSTIPGDPSTEPPHALGTIVLGESHGTGNGDSNPVISASFVPDAKLVKLCTRTVGACELTEVPKCTTGSVQGCATGEVCTFDDSCTAKCVQTCTKACGASETCVITGVPKAGQSLTDADMTCTKKDRFDAGAIAFAGTTQAITLFPPYGVTPNGNGAPFMAQTEIHVQATGGITAGFEKFDEKYTSTTFLETNPPLSEISKSDVFGSGALTIGWLAGQDSVYVTATGTAGSAKCPADDKTGTFDLPRTVIDEVTSSSSSSSSGATGNFSISVTRERREVRKDKKTFGTLSGGQVIQPDGWVELVTSSSESFSFQTCPANTTLCGELCVSTQGDAKNCGACGKVCPTSYYCSVGVCQP